jgi:hypothetical protein
VVGLLREYQGIAHGSLDELLREVITDLLRLADRTPGTPRVESWRARWSDIQDALACREQADELEHRSPGVGLRRDGHGAG